MEYQDAGWSIFRPIGAVSEAHLLIVPRVHIEHFENIWPQDFESLGVLISKCTLMTGCAEYNIGVNIGTSAGQTVPHVHVHFIGREKGDVLHPEGGIVRGLGQQLPGSGFEDYLAKRWVSDVKKVTLATREKPA